MSIRENLRRGRSHLIIATVLIVAGSAVVQIEDRNLSREIGKAVPKRTLGVPGAPIRKPSSKQVNSSTEPAPLSSERAEP